MILQERRKGGHAPRRQCQRSRLAEPGSPELGIRPGVAAASRTPRYQEKDFRGQ